MNRHGLTFMIIGGVVLVLSYGVKSNPEYMVEMSYTDFYTLQRFTTIGMVAGTVGLILGLYYILTRKQDNLTESIPKNEILNEPQLRCSHCGANLKSIDDKYCNKCETPVQTSSFSQNGDLLKYKVKK